MIVKFRRRFTKQFSRAPQDVKKAANIRLDLFASNPQHPLLRNHKLTGRYEGYRSINITGDWRAIYIEIDPINDEVYIEFTALGTHSQLYR